MGELLKKKKVGRGRPLCFSHGVRKKGLSPVIATVLLVMLVMFMAAIVFLWARGFLSEQIEKFGKPVEDQCSLIDFDVAVVPGTMTPYALEVVNHGNIDIYRLEIKKTLGGNSEVTKFKFNIPAGEPKKGDAVLMMNDGGKTPESITVYPALIGNVRGKDSNKVFTCVELGKRIPISKNKKVSLGKLSSFSHRIRKKGISTIVATVLIILITVAAVTIIWAAIIPMIQGNIKGSQECFEASAALNVITDSVLGGTVDVQIHRGTGSFELTGVEIITGAGGTTKSKTFKESSTEGIPGINGEKVYTITYEGAKVTEAGVAAIVKAGLVEKTCSRSGMIQLSDCVVE